MSKRCLSSAIAITLLISMGVALSATTYYFTVNFLKTGENSLKFLPSPTDVNIYVVSANFPQILLESDNYINLNNIVLVLNPLSVSENSENGHIVHCLFTNTSTIVVNTTNGKFYVVNITKGLFSCFSQSCIPPGNYNLEVYYGGYLKDVYTVKITKYVCLNAKIDYINQRIVGYAHWNTGPPYNGTINYAIDKGAAGEGSVNTNNGYFEIKNVTFNFTYLLPFHSWNIRWNQDLPYRGYSFVPAHLCVSSSCVDSYAIGNSPATNPHIYNYYYREIKVDKITPHYILLNFTYVFVPSADINFTSSEKGYTFFIVHTFPFDLNAIKVVKCGDNVSAICNYGMPKINIISNASGLVYNYPAQEVVYQKLTIWNNGSVDLPIGGEYWWKYNDGNKLWLTSTSYKWVQQLRARGRTGYLVRISVVPSSYTYIIPPHSNVVEIWRLNLTKLNNYLEYYYDGLTIRGKTFEVHYEYPGIYNYRFRFAVNSPTANPTAINVWYPIDNSYIVEYKYKRNITHPIKLWFVVNYTRLNDDYTSRVAVYQWTGFINIVENQSIVHSIGAYTAYYGKCYGWWSCISFVDIPNVLREFWRFYYYTIDNYVPGVAIHITHHLIIANTGLNVLSDVSVFKIIANIYWIRNWIHTKWYNNSILFKYNPPEGYNIYNLAGYIYVNLYRSKYNQYIHFEIPGYHNEVLNCTKDPTAYSCNTTLACESNDGKCYSSVRFSVLSSKLVWTSGRVSIPIWNYYTTTHKLEIPLVYNITGNYSATSATIGYRDVKVLAEFVQKNALWKNHMRHTLILTASHTIYQYQFTT